MPDIQQDAPAKPNPLSRRTFLGAGSAALAISAVSEANAQQPPEVIQGEMFKSSRYQDLSLNDWITHTPPELVLQHLKISRETLARIPKDKSLTLPE